MQAFWNFIFRGSGLCFSACAIVLVTVPSASTWKKTASIACAIFGTLMIVAMYFVRKIRHTQEVHLVKREIDRNTADIDDD
jgi:hypothetical protein